MTLYGMNEDQSIDLLDSLIPERSRLIGEFDQEHAKLMDSLRQHSPDIIDWVTTSMLAKYMANVSGGDEVATIVLPGMEDHLDTGNVGHVEAYEGNVYIALYAPKSDEHEQLNTALSSSYPHIRELCLTISKAGERANKIADTLTSVDHMVGILRDNLKEDAYASLQ